jgi:hypothetical protein
MKSLTNRMKVEAATRLARLRSLAFDSLTALGPDELEFVGRLGAKGSVITDIAKTGSDMLRVAVISSATVWWWPGYYHTFDGFRIDRDGAISSLTESDAYDLD